MSNPILKGMAMAYHAMSKTPHYSEEGMKAALLWLAVNVTDEMANAVAVEHATSGDEFRQQPDEDFNEWTLRLRKAAISAALRAAAGGGE